MSWCLLLLVVVAPDDGHKNDWKYVAGDFTCVHFICSILYAIKIAGINIRMGVNDKNKRHITFEVERF